MKKHIIRYALTVALCQVAGFNAMPLSQTARVFAQNIQKECIHISNTARIIVTSPVGRVIALTSPTLLGAHYGVPLLMKLHPIVGLTVASVAGLYAAQAGIGCDSFLTTFKK